VTPGDPPGVTAAFLAASLPIGQHAPVTEPDARPEPFTKTYRVAMAICSPMRWWSAMEVEGLEVLPRSGPVLIVANHDSQTDPLFIGMAAHRRRQIRALAKSDLWMKPGLARVLNGMGQIPIERAAGDANALVNAIAALREGKCIGVFPEGTISVGRKLRARSGIGRLALEVPEAKIVCVAHTGTPDFARFPKRPKVKLRFFEPRSGQIRPGEEPDALSQRLLDEIRTIAPQVVAGRDPAKTLAHYEEKAAAQDARRAERAKAAEREPAG
jgi:1-acyl-sn-glycerol-3-phosphate acyltransferase